MTPNRLQHFQFKSLSFVCESPDGSAELRGIKTSEDKLESFSPLCNSKGNSSSCTITQTYVTDSAEYWCEVKGGQRSNSVNITITGKFIIFVKLVKSFILKLGEIYCPLCLVWYRIYLSFTFLKSLKQNPFCIFFRWFCDPTESSFPCF